MYDFCEKAQWTKENRLLNLWHSDISQLTQPTVTILFSNQPFFIFHSSVGIEKALREILKPAAINFHDFHETAHEVSHAGFVAKSTIFIASMGPIVLQKVII